MNFYFARQKYIYQNYSIPMTVMRIWQLETEIRKSHKSKLLSLTVIKTDGSWLLKLVFLSKHFLILFQLWIEETFKIDYPETLQAKSRYAAYNSGANAQNLVFTTGYSQTEQSFILDLEVGLETVQDFLIKLGIKPLMHLLEISIFSQNNDLVRLRGHTLIT